MIKGVHAMFYSSQVQELRANLRDKLGLKANDIVDSWLIFDLPEADMGVHPAGETSQEELPSGTADNTFYCYNIEGTINFLKRKGVQFKGAIEDQGYAFVTHCKVPGDFFIQLYQPKYGK